MNATGLGTSAVEIRPVGIRPTRRTVAISWTLGGIGALAVLAVYLPLAARLPDRVPWHFALNGDPNGWITPIDLLGVSLLEIGIVTAVFALFLRWTGGSAALVAQFGAALDGPILLLEGIVVAGIFPLVAGLLFAGDAGAIPESGARLGQLLNVVGFVSPVVIIGGALWAVRRHVRTVPPGPGGEWTGRPNVAVGGPTEMRCSSCGEQFRLTGVPLLAPHIGVGPFGSLYVRCPRCGERGWNAVVGRAAG
jgi:hypothetical protein